MTKKNHVRGIIMNAALRTWMTKKNNVRRIENMDDTEESFTRN